MSYRVVLSIEEKKELAKIWGLSDTDEIMDMTPFGDFFVKSADGKFLYYSLTDGEVKAVTNEILEHGLPPVDIALGDEWYQLSAQQMLAEENWEIQAGECFGFKAPVFLGGDYGPDNLKVENICQYSCRIHGLMPKKTT